mmetsp:Transcript_75082/g.232943  ORF Transcript_75082/g.232943 Transcript_75082/m.232943 type:complete len:200 (-) Transcript_75082:469-1068(-)
MRGCGAQPRPVSAAPPRGRCRAAAGAGPERARREAGGDGRPHLLEGKVEESLDARGLQRVALGTVGPAVVPGDAVLARRNEVLRGHHEAEALHRGHVVDVHDLVQAIAPEAHVIGRHLRPSRDQVRLEAHGVLHSVEFTVGQAEPALEVGGLVAPRVPRHVEALGFAAPHEGLHRGPCAWQLHAAPDLKRWQHQRLAPA